MVEFEHKIFIDCWRWFSVARQVSVGGMMEVGTGWFGWSGAQLDGQCLPVLIFPCTKKSRSSLLAPAHPGGPGKRAVKLLW